MDIEENKEWIRGISDFWSKEIKIYESPHVMYVTRDCLDELKDVFGLVDDPAGCREISVEDIP